LDEEDRIYLYKIIKENNIQKDIVMSQITIITLILTFLMSFTTHAYAAPVYVPKDSRVYHYDRNCSELNTDDLMEFTSPEKASEAGGVPCKNCNP
jgi:hypothetical protein